MGRVVVRGRGAMWGGGEDRGGGEGGGGGGGGGEDRGGGEGGGSDSEMPSVLADFSMKYSFKGEFCSHRLFVLVAAESPVQIAN